MENEKCYKVYIYRNKINNKIYIGQTKHTLLERAGLQGQKYEGCTCFYKAIQKYGWENFIGTILEDNLTSQEANEREKYWIKFFDATNKNKGYNLTSGGDNLEGINRTGRRKKVVCKETGQIFSSLTEAAQWAGLTSTGGSNIGSAANGKRLTAGTHPITGEPLHWYFPNCSSIIREKHTKAQKIKNLNTGIIYNSITEAIACTGISYPSIIKSCKSNGTIGINKKHIKYYFIYIN